MSISTTTTRTIRWLGQSGQQYEYLIYPLGTNFKSAPGNYIFAREQSNGFVPIYIGQTSDLAERFDYHHKIGCIRKLEATHIHVHSNTSQSARLNEERDLVQRWNPPCNG